LGFWPFAVVIYLIQGEIIVVKKLIQHENSAALVIDQAIMEMLHITRETSLELSTDGKNIILSPENTIAQETGILESLKRINEK
jgi:antitoxin component of MazEF toxin-antitoxin module